MPLIKGKSKKAFGENISTEMGEGKPQKPSLALAYAMKRKAKKFAAGGKVDKVEGKAGGAETSTTGNKTKTGGSNPGGASTGGAGTVTITTGNTPPKSIAVSDVGGNTEARNGGGMDPSDVQKMALGGAVEGLYHSKKYTRNPGTPAKKPDDTRYPDSETKSDRWSEGNPPARKPDDARRPKSAYLDTNEWSDGETPNRQPFANGGKIGTGTALTSKPNAPRPSQASTETEALNSRAPAQGSSPAQMAEYHEQMAAKYRMYADGGQIGEIDDLAQEDQAPTTPAAKPDDDRRPKSSYIDTERWSDEEVPSRKPFAKGGRIPAHMDIEDENPKASSIADAIMEKKHRMAEGGEVLDSEVDLEENSEEEGSSPYDHLNMLAAGKEQYDDSQLSHDPLDSNEHADSREADEEDVHDMIDKIRAKLRSTRK